jgi:hypothetical protein
MEPAPMTREQEQIRAWTDAIAAEIERRQAAKFEAADHSRQRLFRILDEMHKRLSQAPGYMEATPAEKEQAMADLEVWFGEHGYVSVG